MKKLLVLLIGFVLYSCSNTKDYENIAGKWKCSNWIIESTGEDKCNNNVFFEFRKDKTYTSKIGDLEESGVYQIAEGTLYSTPEGKMEIGVEITVLNRDTLQFVMSRSGVKEVLTLLHQK
ncbi:lipocalin family protein [Flavobacterium sp.]|uniref:lipocalin family protein n=1 Tax=Flavobacterium sp. TaxID=239 RepID=UPI00263822E8|nr:lipocalin family protein [Flavobacterium sp.]